VIAFIAFCLFFFFFFFFLNRKILFVCVVFVGKKKKGGGKFLGQKIFQKLNQPLFCLHRQRQPTPQHFSVYKKKKKKKKKAEGNEGNHTL